MLCAGLAFHFHPKERNCFLVLATREREGEREVVDGDIKKEAVVERKREGERLLCPK